ncbi:MAG: sigma-54-dependent Fis family transcriptional regulator [Oxalobacter sp.]|nr:sigma-54-dependent Fis family transcriptional regulator [Oxalobacter sp.]
MPFKQLSDFLQSLTEPHLLFDAEYRIISVNPAFRKYCNSQHSVIGKTCYEVSHGYELPCDRSGESCPLKKSLESGKTEHVLHMHNTPEGEEYVSIALTPIKDADASIIGFVEKINPLKTVRHVPSDQLKGISAPFRAMKRLLDKAAASDIPVLIEGETGTGKNTVAQYIHQSGKRCAEPFVTVDCPTLADSQFDPLFFGEKSSDRTARNNKVKGILDTANGGTLFLNNVSGLSPYLQAKVASLLETDIYSHTDTVNTQKTDIRIIASSSGHLQKQVEQGLFREDLYYHLNRLPIDLPTLRERQEDIPFLCQIFLKQFSENLHLTISDEALYHLQTYRYPGNIRELKAIIERACLLCDDGTIQAEHLLLPKTATPQMMETVQPLSDDESQLLTHFKGNKKNLAKMLGISERTLYRKLAKLKENPTV